jgi:hypothetical protein
LANFILGFYFAFVYASSDCSDYDETVSSIDDFADFNSRLAALKSLLKFRLSGSGISYENYIRQYFVGLLEGDVLFLLLL